MKQVGIFFWARDTSTAARLRECLRTSPAIDLVEEKCRIGSYSLPDGTDCPNALQVILLARDPFVEAYLQHQLSSSFEVSFVYISKQEDNPDAVIVDNQLLTPSEKRVLQACAKYDRLSEVANHLFLTEATVKKHLSHIYAKLGRHSLHRALLSAVQWGIIDALA